MSGAPSPEKALRILALFSEERLEWTPEEMMAELGYARPTLYRYLKMLREAGLVTSLPGAGFTLGPRVVEMDFLMRKSDRLVLAGQGELVGLTGVWPCSALLVRWYGERLLCVASECSTPNPLSSYPRGRPMPLVRGAIARSIMASLPRRQMQQIISDNLDEFAALGLGDGVEEVAARFRAVRRAGVAVAHGEVTPGVVGIAAPIFDATRTPIASLCVTIAGNIVGGAQIDEIGRQVRGGAEDISERLSDQRQGFSRAESGPLCAPGHPRAAQS